MTFNRLIPLCLGAALVASPFSAPLNGGLFDRFVKTYKSKYWASGPTVKVLISEGKPQAVLEVKGSYNLFDPNKQSRLSTRFGEKENLVIPQRVGLKWGEEFPGTYQISVVPDENETPIVVDGIEYSGVVNIYQVDGKLFIVNEVSLEDFVRSTLAQNVVGNYSEETLASLAIVLRTKGFYYSKMRESKDWHIRAKEIGFQGSASMKGREEFKEAIAKTKHMVLSEHDPRFEYKPFNAMWTAHSAGKTIPYHLVFGSSSHGNEKSVYSPVATRDRENTKWTYQLSGFDLAKLANLEQITKIKAVRDHDSNKVVAVQVFDGEHGREIPFLDIQNEIGKDYIQSNDFEVALDADLVSFTGYGKGHGVGLCVYTAEYMAQKGVSAAKILGTFFPDAEIKIANKKGKEAFR